MKSEYTQVFRDRAVELTLQSDRSVPMIAEELGINAQTLYSWRRDYRRKVSKTPGSEASSRVTQAEENAAQGVEASHRRAKHPRKKQLATSPTPRGSSLR